MSMYSRAGYTPPQAPKPPAEPRRKKGGSGGRRPPTRRPGGRIRFSRRAKAVFALLLTLIVLVLATMGVAVFMSLYVHAYDDAFVPGVYIGNVPLGGLTPEEAAQQLSGIAQQGMEGWHVNLIYQDVTKTITPQDLSMTFDVGDQLNRAWAIGRSGSLFERFMQIRQAQQEPVTIVGEIAYDEARLDEILSQVQAGLERQVQNATSSFEPSSDTPFSFTDEVYGRHLDTAPVREQIVEAIATLTSCDITLEPELTAPEITRAMLEENLSAIVIVTSNISSSSDEGRNQNIAVALDHLNGLVISAGERVSFNSAVGKRTTENGYTTALEIAYGEYVEGIGGGVCQVSTALYQAVLRAGLEVLERTPHAIPSNYAEMGQDATVSDRGLDFVFRNSSDMPIYIKARLVTDTSRKYIEITIFGKPLPDSIRYTLESTVIETIPLPEPVYVRDKDAQYVVYDDEEYQASDGREGYVVETYRVTSQNGAVTERELISTDTYDAKAPEIYVGAQPRPTPTPAPTPTPTPIA